MSFGHDIETWLACSVQRRGHALWLEEQRPAPRKDSRQEDKHGRWIAGEGLGLVNERATPDQRESGGETQKLAGC